MLKPINLSLGGDNYQLLPHTGFEAIDLHRKANGVIARMAGRFEFGSAGQAADLAAFSGAFETYSSAEYADLLVSTLNRVTVVTIGKKNQALSDMDRIAEQFQGRFDEMLTLVFMVWGEEKLIPFKIAPAMEQSEMEMNGNETMEIP